MTDFDDDERSTRGSRPVDLYTLATSTVTYYLTSNVVDVTHGGQTYTATTMSRGAQQVAQDLAGREIIVYLPITHPVVQRYVAFGVPERDLLVTLHRLQQRSGIAFQQYQGFGTAMSIEGHIAALSVPSLTDDAMKIRLPAIVAQRICNHVLYDPQCTVSRESFTDLLTVVDVTGNTISIDFVPLPSGHYKFGDIEHVPSGERRMVVNHIAGSGTNVLTLNIPFVNVGVGDQIRVAAGCAHDVNTCRSKFDNAVNYGGMPSLSSESDPWTPAGVGQVQQS